MKNLYMVVCFLTVALFCVSAFCEDHYDVHYDEVPKEENVKSEFPVSIDFHWGDGSVLETFDINGVAVSVTDQPFATVVIADGTTNKCAIVNETDTYIDYVCEKIEKANGNVAADKYREIAQQYKGRIHRIDGCFWGATHTIGYIFFGGEDVTRLEYDWDTKTVRIRHNDGTESVTLIAN